MVKIQGIGVEGYKVIQGRCQLRQRIGRAECELFGSTSGLIWKVFLYEEGSRKT